MSEERYSLRCATYVILIKENKIFLERRINTGWMDGYWGVPGGHLEANETVSQAAVREALEEAGVIIKIEDLELAQVMHRRTNTDYIDVCFKTTKWEGEPKLTEEDKSDDLMWVDMDNLPENTLESVKETIKNMKKGVIYSEVGF